MQSSSGYEPLEPVDFDADADDHLYETGGQWIDAKPRHSRNRDAVRSRAEDSGDVYLDYRGESGTRRGRASSPRVRRRHLSSASHPTPVQPTATGWESFSEREQYQSYASLGIGFASLVGETLLSHPCIVLRRQCQVMNSGINYHLTPISLVPVVYNLHKSQGIACLWKGIGSVFIIRGLYLVTENLVSEATNWPKEVNRHSSWRKLAQNLCLKATSWAIVAPFYAASLVETVQSDIASDSPGVLDCLKEGAGRFLVFSTPTASSNLLPFWKLMPPVAALGLCSYCVRSLANFAAMRSAEQPAAGRQYRGQRGRSTEVDSELYERFHTELMAGFAGSLLADALLFPLETVAHRLCAQGTRALIDNLDTGSGVASLSSAYAGAADAFATVARAESPLGLYRGFGALVLQFGAHLCLLRLAKASYERLVDAWATARARPEPGEEESASSDGRLSSDADDSAA